MWTKFRDGGGGSDDDDINEVSTWPWKDPTGFLQTRKTGSCFLMA